MTGSAPRALACKRDMLALPVIRSTAWFGDSVNLCSGIHYK